MNQEIVLIKRLDSLRRQHRELDNQIEETSIDEFTRQRFKKMKLQLRDEIIRIEQMVYPDIIA
ncbi:MAG: YdcH family protein [Alphaproteobacteria bacterium]